MSKKLAVLRARVAAFDGGLTGFGQSRKSDGNVSIQLAEQFNGILNELRKEIPEMATDLPTNIDTRDRFHSDFGVTALSFVELKIMTQQTIGVIDVYLSEGR